MICSTVFSWGARLMNSNLRNRRSLGRSSQLLRALCTLVHIHRLSNCSAVRRPQKSSLLGRYLLAGCCAQLTPRTQIQHPNDRSNRLKQESLACRHNTLPFWIISTSSQSCFTEKGLLCFWTMMVNSSTPLLNTSKHFLSRHCAGPDVPWVRRYPHSDCQGS